MKLWRKEERQHPGDGQMDGRTDSTGAASYRIETSVLSRPSITGSCQSGVSSQHTRTQLISRSTNDIRNVLRHS